MIDDWRFILTIVSALGCGLNGGVFFAFSTFVMKGLGRLPPAHGIAGMQSINVTAVSPAFMLLFLGTAALCLVLALATLWSGAARAAAGSNLVLAGCLLYFVGTFVVTIVFNVPRNDALARISADSAEGTVLWADYLRTWTAWNHVRTLTSTAAAASLVWALLTAPRG